MTGGRGQFFSGHVQCEVLAGPLVGDVHRLGSQKGGGLGFRDVRHGDISLGVSVGKVTDVKRGQDSVRMQLAKGGHLREKGHREIKKRSQRCKKEAWFLKKHLLANKG